MAQQISDQNMNEHNNMSNQMDLKFFTNESGRTLYERFDRVLKSHTQYFDVLVGYFRTSGFFRMYPQLESIEKIRILVGLNVDHFTVDLIDRANNEIKYSTLKEGESKEYFSNDIQKEFENSEMTSRVQEGVKKFIEWLNNGKLEMRIYTKSPIHAKVYIMRKNPEEVPDTFGSVITGSSNFSDAGLVRNLEFNVELKDYSDVKFALDEFDKLWREAVDIKDTYVNAVNNVTWIRDDITPYQLYLKTLYEFFKDEIDADKNSDVNVLLPQGYLKLQYQIDAVIQAKQKLNAYNGVFISDVVGLGKTYICAMLANTFNRDSYKLFICPPVLVDYWREVLQDFDVSRFDVFSLGEITKIAEGNNFDKYEYIFVDEAHRFRNSDTESYTALHKICLNKKVVLISATPINNYNSDIENLLYLFQKKHNGTINGVKNLDGFFKQLKSSLSHLEKNSEAYVKQTRHNSEIIRDRLLREVMIRRTRSEIKTYYADDLKKQNISFPEVGTPEEVVYEFDEETDNAFNYTIDAIKKLKYARYIPLLYLRNGDAYGSLRISQTNLKGFMKSILIKRLESSFHAFRMTLSRFIDSYEKFISMYRSGTVYISKKVDVYEYLDNGDDVTLMNLVDNPDVMTFQSSDFGDDFIKDLENDKSILVDLKNKWDKITKDPKLERFKCKLEQIQHNGKKIIVFTESKETASYLHDSLNELYSGRVIDYSSQSSKNLKAEIENSFNPKYKSNNSDKYDILITTDVLAEGVNLNRANSVVNYDLPWNPTKIMQRVGRVNRVGTDYDKIFVYNFFPTAQADNQLSIDQRILNKLQAFHDTLGDDIKYLTDSEDVSPKKLFDELQTNLNSSGDDSTSDLHYLEAIRKVRDDMPDLYTQIKKLPRKIKSGKKFAKCEYDNATIGEYDNATIGFIKKGSLKAFFISSDNGATRYLSFNEAINYIEAESAEPSVHIGDNYFEQYKKNEAAFENYLYEDKIASTLTQTLSPTEADVVKKLKGLMNSTMDVNQKTQISTLINAFDMGIIPSKIAKQIKRFFKDLNDFNELYNKIFENVPSNYLVESNHSLDKTKNLEEEKEVILSLYLVKGD